MFSNFSLVIINLFVGLCRGAHGLPSALKRLGYQDKWIERKFHNQDRDEVHPELVLSSQLRRHTLMIEAKAGPNTDEDQLRRYSQVCSEDVEERLFIPADECVALDLSIVGLRAHRERLRIGLQREETAFPLLLANDDGLSLDLNEFSYEELSEVFRPLLEIPWDAVPMSWIPFDHNSDLWEVAEVVIPAVLSEMVRREPRVTVRSICETTSSWSMIGRRERGQMEAKVRAVLAEAAAQEFSDYFRLAGNHLVIEQNPVELDAAQSTLGFQKLQRLQTGFLHRLRAEGQQLELPM